MKEWKYFDIFFRVLVVLVVLFGVVAVLSVIKVTPLEVYRDPQYHFSLKYPAYWTKIDRPEEGLALVLFTPPRTSTAPKFGDSLNIVAVDLARTPQLQELERFSSTTAKQLLAALGDRVTVTESRRIRLGGQPAYRFACVTREATPLGVKMKYFHVWTLRGHEALIMTYVGEADDFDANLRHLNRIIRTFRFLK